MKMQWSNFRMEFIMNFDNHFILFAYYYRRSRHLSIKYILLDFWFIAINQNSNTANCKGNLVMLIFKHNLLNMSISGIFGCM